MPDTATDDRIYHGCADGRLVTVESSAGDLVGVLHNHGRRHSPDGFAWGYSGSGPAALARSLLIDALGREAAKCPDCEGYRRLVWDEGTGTDVPCTPEREARVPTEMATEWIGWCGSCDDGYRRLPYQDFKFDVIAKLPDGEWWLTRSEVLAWLAAHQEAAL